MDKNNVMMTVIIILLVVLLGIIGFMSFYLMDFFANSKNAPPAPQIGSERHVPQDQQVTVVYDEPIKGLISEPGANPHAITFKLSIGLDNSDKKQSKAVADLNTLLVARESVIKSFVSEILYNHPHEDFADNTGTMKTTLSKEILERLQVEFQTDLIVDVYLSEYLYQ